EPIKFGLIIFLMRVRLNNGGPRRPDIAVTVSDQPQTKIYVCISISEILIVKSIHAVEYILPYGQTIGGHSGNVTFDVEDKRLAARAGPRFPEDACDAAIRSQDKSGMLNRAIRINNHR